MGSEEGVKSEDASCKDVSGEDVSNEERGNEFLSLDNILRMKSDCPDWLSPTTFGERHPARGIHSLASYVFAFQMAFYNLRFSLPLFSYLRFSLPISTLYIMLRTTPGKHSCLTQL